MIYQLTEKILPLVLILDIILLVIIIFIITIKKRILKNVLLGIVTLAYLGVWSLKLFMLSPHPMNFEPSYLKTEQKEFYSSFYYFNERKDKIFWKEHLIGKSKTRLLDQRRFGHDNFMIIKEFNDKWFITSVKLKDNNTTILQLEKKNFKEDQNGHLKRYVENYLWIEKGNYSSNLLSLLFLIVLIWHFYKKRS